MHSVMSFHSSGIPPDQLSAIVDDYLALERARIYRRLFVTRFSILAAVIVLIGAGFQLLPAFGTWFSVGLALVPPAGALVLELKCDRRLARRLERVPGGITDAVAARPSPKKVIKSS